MLSTLWCALHVSLSFFYFFFFFFKQKTAYEMRISDWSSDVCSSDLRECAHPRSSLRCVSKAQSKGAWLFPKPAIRSPAWPAGLRGEIKEEAAAVRRMPGDIRPEGLRGAPRSEEHTSELQSLMRISYSVFCLKKKRPIVKTYNR